MPRDPRDIHDFDQLGGWLEDATAALAKYKRDLREEGEFSDSQIDEMVMRLECRLFADPVDPYDYTVVPVEDEDEPEEEWGDTVSE